MADDCDWWVAGHPVVLTVLFLLVSGPPFLGLASNVEDEVNEVQEVIAQDETVVVLGHDRVRVRPTGKPLAKRWAMVFNLDAGRVAGFRAYEDTNAIAAAFTAG